MPADSITGENPLPGSHRATALLCPYVAERKSSGLSSSRETSVGKSEHSMQALPASKCYDSVISWCLAAGGRCKNVGEWVNTRVRCLWRERSLRASGTPQTFIKRHTFEMKDIIHLRSTPLRYMYKTVLVEDVSTFFFLAIVVYVNPKGNTVSWISDKAYCFFFLDLSTMPTGTLAKESSQVSTFECHLPCISCWSCLTLSMNLIQILTFPF